MAVWCIAGRTGEVDARLPLRRRRSRWGVRRGGRVTTFIGLLLELRNRRALDRATDFAQLYDIAAAPPIAPGAGLPTSGEGRKSVLIGFARCARVLKAWQHLSRPNAAMFCRTDEKHGGAHPLNSLVAPGRSAGSRPSTRRPREPAPYSFFNAVSYTAAEGDLRGGPQARRGAAKPCR